MWRCRLGSLGYNYEVCDAAVYGQYAILISLSACRLVPYTLPLGMPTLMCYHDLERYVDGNRPTFTSPASDVVKASNEAKVAGHLERTNSK
jgi:hypothetical protein